MKMNRRNVLVGIGTAAVGSGAALGSGALTSVSASRDLNITTVDDNNGANVGLVADSPLVGTTTGNNGQTILQIDLNSLNDDATTTLSPAFTITNNLGEAVGVRIQGAPADVTIESNNNGHNLKSWPASGDDHSLTSGGSVSVDLIIDTSSVSDSDNTITIEASTAQSA